MFNPGIARSGEALVIPTIFPERLSIIWGSVARPKRSNGHTSSSG
jgi:hypothetical protein